MIDIIDSIKLENASKAIRMCHDTIDKCDSVNGIVGENDKDLIKRVGVKMKHASTLEHLRFTFCIKRLFELNLYNKDYMDVLGDIIFLQEFFKNNKYTVYEDIEDKKDKCAYIISTNMRVIVENNKVFTDTMLKMFVPEEYIYLLKEEEK